MILLVLFFFPLLPVVLMSIPSLSLHQNTIQVVVDVLIVYKITFHVDIAGQID